MITESQKDQFSNIFNEFGKALDITETEYDAIVTSYRAMGTWLADNSSSLQQYDPAILPQGSFMLGTMVHPVSDDDDLDIDLVCQLKRKPSAWTQYNLKNAVGDRIKENDTYKSMLNNEGKRCWTLKYAKGKYHMDILPCFVNDNYQKILEQSFSEIEQQDADSLAIKITDKTRSDYYTEKNIENWFKSNPFGYAKWFFNIATRPSELRRSFSLSASIAPIPKFDKTKLPLQRVVQLLKRHRDIMFDGNENKPISIIITTLAARSYQGETTIFDALDNIVRKMPMYIEDRMGVKWVANPVNPEENFADKWQKEPKKEQNFYLWIEQLRSDLNVLMADSGQGLPKLSTTMKQMFGETLASTVFSKYGGSSKDSSSNGTLKMAATTGMLGAIGRTTVASHNFFGNNEDE